MSELIKADNEYKEWIAGISTDFRKSQIRASMKINDFTSGKMDFKSSLTVLLSQDCAACNIQVVKIRQSRIRAAEPKDETL